MHRKLTKSRIHATAIGALIIALASGCRPDSAAQSARPSGDGHDHAHGGGHDHDHDHASEEAGPAASAIKPTLDEGWCGGHGVPESVCTRCNNSLIPKFKEAGDWCAEHALPESQCTKCHPEVAALWARLNATPNAPDVHGDTSGIGAVGATRSLRAPGDPLCDVESRVIRFNSADIAAKAGIETAPVERQRISAVVESPAEVRYDNSRLARITPRVEGVVVEVFADLGSQVAAGDQLATLDSPTMGESKATYIAAVQQHAIADADLQRHNTIHDGIERMLQECCATEATSDELRRKYAEVRLGEYKSRLLTAHANLELARERFTRKSGLVEQGISSQDEFQTARRDHDQAQAEFSAVHESIELEMEREHVALDRALRVAAVTLDAARRRLEVLGVEELEITKLAAGEGGAISRYTVRSPMAGRVVNRHAVVGENMSADEEIFAVADTARMWLLLNLQERDLATVKTGDRVLFTVDGLPGRSFEGAIDWISSEVEEPTRTIRARVPLDNTDGMLRANMFGRARVIVHDDDEVLVVPEPAIQSDGCCTIVFVRESDTVYRPRKVVPGATAHGVVEVRSGLAMGDAVVTTGSFLFKTEVLKGNIGAGCCEVEPGR